MNDLGAINVVTEVRRDMMADLFVIEVRGAYLVKKGYDIQEAAQEKLLELKAELAKRNVVI